MQMRTNPLVVWRVVYSFGAAILLAFAIPHSEAATTWRYDVAGQLAPGASNPWNVRFTGMLTTDGNVADLAVPQTFMLSSIDSFYVNNFNLSERFYWVGSSGLPFRSGAIGAVKWDGATGIIDSETSSFVTAGLFPPPIQSLRITLAPPGQMSTAVGLNEDARLAIGWTTRDIRFLSTTAWFTPIPESSTLLLSIVAVTVFLLGRTMRTKRIARLSTT